LNNAPHAALTAFFPEMERRSIPNAAKFAERIPLPAVSAHGISSDRAACLMAELSS
jgi:hypothetical protein